MSKAQTPKALPVSSLQYRPRDYFARYDLQAELLTHVKGRARREMIKGALENGAIDELPDFLKEPELESFDRTMLGRMHPMFLGGEFLARLKPKEVEIARISIRSTTFDVTVVYARLVGKRIHYRVVDEYEGETLEEPTTRTSVRPLSMGQLIDFFLHAWDLMGCLEMNYPDDVEEMQCFFEAESEFYPCLDETLRGMVQERFAPETDGE
jgi:hypothetical protein